MTETTTYGWGLLPWGGAATGYDWYGGWGNEAAPLDTSNTPSNRRTNHRGLTPASESLGLVKGRDKA